MKKSRFTEAQIVAILKEGEAGRRPRQRALRSVGSGWDIPAIRRLLDGEDYPGVLTGRPHVG